MASLVEPLQGGPYPDPDDDNDIPNDLRQIVEWAASRSVMRFTDEAERDSLLPTPTEGMVCSTDVGTALTLWLYKNSDWRRLSVAGEDDTGWLTITSFASGWGPGNVTPQIRRIGGLVTCRGGVSPTSTVNMTNTYTQVITEWPEGLGPGGTQNFALVVAGGVMDASVTPASMQLRSVTGTFSVSSSGRIGLAPLAWMVDPS